MRRLLPQPSRRLTALLAVAAVGGATAGVATASRSGDPEPPASKPLATAVLDALSSPAPPGLVADVEVTNRLLPSAGPAASLAGRLSGEIHLARTGAFKLTLGSDAGPLELTGGDRGITLYDGRSDTEYSLPLPDGAVRPPGPRQAQVLQQAMGALARTFDLSDPEPDVVARRPAYTIRITPRDDGGLLGSAEVSWDAERPIPLRVAVYAQAHEEPVFALELTRIAYRHVPASAVAPLRHPGAERVEVAAAGVSSDATAAGAAGVREVRAAMDFDLAAPRTLAGLPRRTVRTVQTDAGPGALSVYGSGLGSVFVTQWRSRGADAPGAGNHALVHINIDGATGVELANPLGTALQVRRDGVTYVIAGLVPPIVAERAARELR